MNMDSARIPASGSNVLDLEEYRKQRIENGTWPPKGNEHLEFFRRWREDQKK